MKLSEDAKKYLAALLATFEKKRADSHDEELWAAREDSSRKGYKGQRATGPMLDAEQKWLGDFIDSYVDIHLQAFRLDQRELDDQDAESIVEKVSEIAGKFFRSTAERNKELVAFPIFEDSVVRKAASYARDKLQIEILKARLEQKAPTTVPPDVFSFVADDRIRGVLDKDYQELLTLSPDKTPKAILVVCGGILEGLLLDVLVAIGEWGFESACSKTLNHMIPCAVHKKIITEPVVTEAVRQYRNLIHPARVVRNDIRLTNHDADLAKAALAITIRQLSDWHAKSKSSNS